MAVNFVLAGEAFLRLWRYHHEFFFLKPGEKLQHLLVALLNLDEIAVVNWLGPQHQVLHVRVVEGFGPFQINAGKMLAN